jgi:hypothetical protein
MFGLVTSALRRKRLLCDDLFLDQLKLRIGAGDLRLERGDLLLQLSRPVVQHLQLG